MAELHPFAALGLLAWIALGIGLIGLGHLTLDDDPGHDYGMLIWIVNPGVILSVFLTIMFLQEGN